MDSRPFETKGWFEGLSSGRCLAFFPEPQALGAVGMLRPWIGAGTLPSKGINRGRTAIIGVGQPQHAEVQMWTVGAASYTGETEVLSTPHDLTLYNINATEVGIHTVEYLPLRGSVPDAHHQGTDLSQIATIKRRFKVSKDDLPVSHRDNGGAFGHIPVVAIVAIPEGFETSAPPRQHVVVAMVALKRQRQVMVEWRAIVVEEPDLKRFLEQAQSGIRRCRLQTLTLPLVIAVIAAASQEGEPPEGIEHY